MLSMQYLINRVVYPIMQSYVLTGEFSVKEKIFTSIKENLIFYLIIGVVGIVAGLWILIANRTFKG